MIEPFWERQAGSSTNGIELELERRFSKGVRLAVGTAPPISRSLHADQWQLAEPGVSGYWKTTERCVRRGSHTAVGTLEKAMLAYLDQRNENPKPFVWTADADLILGSVERLSKCIFRSGH